MKRRLRYFIIGAFALALSAAAFVGCDLDKVIDEMGCNHDYGNSAAYVTKEATCMEEGEEIWTCRNCGKEVAETIPVKAHAYGVSEMTKDATCTETGIITYTCINTGCGYMLTEEIAATGHAIVNIEGVAPTCLSTGLTIGGECIICDKIIYPQEVIEITSHNWDYGLITKESTCSETGVLMQTCQTEGCTATRNVNIQKDDHTVEIIPELLPTCVDSGYAEHYICSVCNMFLAPKVVYSALGHSPSFVDGIPATCIETGLTDGKICFVCGEVIVGRDIIPALGHTVRTLAAVEATCEMTGMTSGVDCLMCGEVIVEQVTIPALGHSYDESNDCIYCSRLVDSDLTTGVGVFVYEDVDIPVVKFSTPISSDLLSRVSLTDNLGLKCFIAPVTAFDIAIGNNVVSQSIPQIDWISRFNSMGITDYMLVDVVLDKVMDNVFDFDYQITNPNVRYVCMTVLADNSSEVVTYKYPVFESEKTFEDYGFSVSYEASKLLNDNACKNVVLDAQVKTYLRRYINAAVDLLNGNTIVNDASIPTIEIQNETGYVLTIGGVNICDSVQLAVVVLPTGLDVAVDYVIEGDISSFIIDENGVLKAVDYGIADISVYVCGLRYDVARVSVSIRTEVY